MVLGHTQKERETEKDECLTLAHKIMEGKEIMQIVKLSKLSV
jgi:hypothetical protein